MHTSTATAEIMLASWCTDQGKFRSRNEDCCFVDLDLGIFIVTDGVGGHAGGDIASRIATDEFASQFRRLLSSEFESSIGDMEACVCRAIQAVQCKYAGFAVADVSFEKMACCLAFVVAKGGRLFYGRIGDCRIYTYQDGQLRLLLKDESYVQELVDRNLLSAAEAKTSHLRHLITNCLSQMTPYAMTVYHQSFVPGTQVILTTDGVSDFLELDDFSQTLDACDRSEAARQLVDKALVNGSRDNLTCITLEHAFNFVEQDSF
ncbi:MAG: serine/threonine-protein phosphatase [Planctomycetales bacterium]|nr:serine/threonine-protein phosphatase [Planctomycetales bacterium]